MRPGYKQTDVGEIPEEREAQSMRRIVEQLVAGVSVNSVEGEGSAYTQSWCVLKTSAVSNGKFLPSECKKIAKRDLSRVNLRPIADTIIISRMNTPDLVGECGYVEVNHQNLFLPDRLWTTKRRPGSDASVRWLSYLLSSDPQKARIRDLATGTSGSMKNLSKDALLNLPIPIPPSQEQRAIAEALSDVDGLLGALDRLIAKKRDLKQAAMQQLLTAQTRLPRFFGDWGKRRIGEICEIAMGRTPPRLKQADWGPGYRWLSIADLQKKIVSDSKEEINKLVASMLSIIPKGTLLMSFKLSLGRLCFAGCDLFTNEAICSFNKLQANADFLYYVLGRTDFSLYGKQAVKGYTLSKESLNLIEVPFPSLPEQTAIAEVLSDMDAELAALEQRREKTRALNQGMMQELLTGRTRLL